MLISLFIRFLVANKKHLVGYFIAINLVTIFTACRTSTEKKTIDSLPQVFIDTLNNEIMDEQILSEIEQTFIEHQLVDIQMLDSSIFVDLKYASRDNFLDTNIYGNIKKAYLQKDVVEKLVKASQLLQQECDSCRLLIYDAARPQSVQFKMWEKVKSMPVQQGVYVSNPSKGSVHNFGAAVDLTIVFTNGNTMDMGTPFDYFGKEAWITSEDSLVKVGKLTREQVNNRKLLRRTMQQAGFRAIPSEWWHFNAYSRPRAQELYPIIK